MVEYKQVDEVIKRYLEETKNHWLLNQTLVNAKMRRDILAMFPIEKNANVLDVGTGFGAVSHDLASQMPVQIEAIDVNEERIKIARGIRDYLTKELPLPGTISFSNETIYELPYEDQQFDVVIAWFVFQHLENVDNAVEELKRVLTPGGYICLVDVDDQFLLTYPTPSKSAQFMHQALCTLQEKQGGDRYIGRKLPTYLHKAGFEVVGTAIQPQTAFTEPAAQNQTPQLEVNLYQQLESDFIENSILTKAEFDHHIQTLIAEKQPPKFKSNAQVIVLGQVPA